MSDYSIYPKAIDGYAQIPLVVDKKSPINAESVNRLRSGIINIEKAIGVAPEFSDKFGSFPDFASRIDNLESQFVLDTSLTALYELDNIIQIDEEPLVLKSPYGASCGLGFADENFIIGSSSGLEFEAKGTFSGEGPVTEWPKSVAIKKSETVPFAEGGPGGLVADMGVYLSLGGQIHESDLTIFKMEPQAGQGGQGPGQLANGSTMGLMVGVNAALDASLDPVSLSIQCLGASKPGAEGGFIELQAGEAHGEASAGTVSIRSGANVGHSYGKSSQIAVDGPGWHGPPDGPKVFHAAAVRLHGTKRGEGGQTSYPSGAMVECWGGAEAGGTLYMESGSGHSTEGPSSNSNGGAVVIASGAGKAGGAIAILSGHSSGENEAPSNISIVANGGLGEVNIVGDLSVHNGGLSMPIRAHLKSIHGPICLITENDYTIIIYTDEDNVHAQLPPANTCFGRIYNIKKRNNNNIVTIGDPSGQDIDGNNTMSLHNENDGITIQSNGQNWFILSSIG